MGFIKHFLMVGKS